MSDDDDLYMRALKEALANDPLMPLMPRVTATLEPDGALHLGALHLGVPNVARDLMPVSVLTWATAAPNADCHRCGGTGGLADPDPWGAKRGYTMPCPCTKVVSTDVATVAP